MKVLVAGGGIGGIAAALCLARVGFDVEVFEQAPGFVESGAGIQLSPNCSRVPHYRDQEVQQITPMDVVVGKAVLLTHH